MNYIQFSAQMYGSGVFLTGFPFILCYFATNMTQNLLSIADVAQSDISWYQLPPSLRKYVLLIIQRAQEPVYITGLGLVHSTLYNFAMVGANQYQVRIIFYLFNHFYRFHDFYIVSVHQISVFLLLGHS